MTSPHCSVAAPLTTLSTASLTKRGSPMPDSFPSDAEWPIDNMPAMPLRRGMIMVRVASRELRYLHGKVKPSLARQHVLAVQVADNKWKAEQSRLAYREGSSFPHKSEGVGRTRERVWRRFYRDATGSAFAGIGHYSLLTSDRMAAMRRAVSVKCWTSCGVSARCRMSCSR